MVIVSFKPKIPKNNNAFCLASEASKQNPRHRTLDLPFFFHYQHMISLKNHPSLAQGESLPYWFRGSFYDCVCFDLPAERISLVCSH